MISGVRKFLKVVVLLVLAGVALMMIRGMRASKMEKLFVAFRGEGGEVQMRLVDPVNGAVIKQGSFKESDLDGNLLYPVLLGAGGTSPIFYDSRNSRVLMVTHRYNGGEDDYSIAPADGTAVYTLPIDGSGGLEEVYYGEGVVASRVVLDELNGALLLFESGENNGSGKVRKLSLSNWGDRVVAEFQFEFDSEKRLGSLYDEPYLPFRKNLESAYFGEVQRVSYDDFDLILSDDAKSLFIPAKVSMTGRPGFPVSSLNEELVLVRIELESGLVSFINVVRGDSIHGSSEGLSGDGKKMAFLEGWGSYEVIYTDLDGGGLSKLGVRDNLSNINAWLSRGGNKMALVTEEGIEMLDMKGGMLGKLPGSYIYSWSGSGDWMLVKVGHDYKSPGVDEIVNTKTGSSAPVKFKQPNVDYDYLSVSWVK